MLNNFESYWRVLQFRIKERVDVKLGLESLVIKRQRVNINNGKLSYRTEKGYLAMHTYTQESNKVDN